jgi:hypothetical protein
VEAQGRLRSGSLGMAGWARRLMVTEDPVDVPTGTVMIKSFPACPCRTSLPPLRPWSARYRRGRVCTVVTEIAREGDEEAHWARMEQLGIEMEDRKWDRQ